MRKTINIMFFAAILISSCKKDDNTDQPIPKSNNRKAYVVNEGSFGSSNGSITRVDLVSGDLVQNIFQTANNRPLGDVVQSMTVDGDKGYIVVNNSKKVEIVNLSDFSSVFTLTGLSGPRFIKVSGSKAYISDWGANDIKIFNTVSGIITNQISTGSGPEQIEIIGNHLFVCNAGGFSDDSTITVINLLSETVVKTIAVGLRPNSMVVDANNKLWVLCSGSLGADWTPGTADDIAGSLHRIDPATGLIEQTFAMNQSDHPRNIKRNVIGDKIFYLYGSSDYTGEPRAMSITDNNLPGNSIINRQCYGLGIDPVSDMMYCAIAPSFSTSGSVLRVDQSTSVVIDSLSAGIGPNGFAFED